MDNLDSGHDSALLIDVARGFIAARDRKTAVRLGLLSLMGTCGCSFAALLERTDDNSFTSAAERGLLGPAPLHLRLNGRTEKLLAAEPGPHLTSLLAPGDPELRKLTDATGAQVLFAVQGPAKPALLVLLGPRLLGDSYREVELNAAQPLFGFFALSLSTWMEREQGPGSVGLHRQTPAPTNQRSASERARILRREYPALAPIRGESPAMVALLDELLSLADFEQPVLIEGETGTGKELAARALHHLSARASEPFEALNCAAVSRHLVADELFGHEKGAFTDARATKRGLFELAGKGTVFLDEIRDMPLDTQAVLLRVLQEREFRRVGGAETLPMRARVISACNHELADDVRAGRFRADLFYRIQMYCLRVPPLRERREDIPELVATVLEREAKNGRPAPAVSAAFTAELRRRHLPGNVRQLEGLVLAAAARARGGKLLQPEHLSPELNLAPRSGVELERTVELGRTAAARGNSPLASEAGAVPAVGPGHDRSTPTDMPEAIGDDRAIPAYEEMERHYVQSVLRVTEGNKKEAATLMGIPRTTLNARIKRLGIETSR